MSTSISNIGSFSPPVCLQPSVDALRSIQNKAAVFDSHIEIVVTPSGFVGGQATSFVRDMTPAALSKILNDNIFKLDNSLRQVRRQMSIEVRKAGRHVGWAKTKGSDRAGRALLVIVASVAARLSEAAADFEVSD